MARGEEILHQSIGRARNSNKIRPKIVKRKNCEKQNVEKKIVKKKNSGEKNCGVKIEKAKNCGVKKIEKKSWRKNCEVEKL